MRKSLKHAMLTGASLAFLAISGATITSSPAQAGPLSVTPKQNVAPAALTQNVQMRVRGGRVGVRHGGVRRVGVRYRGARYARGGYYYRRGYGNAFFPAAALGLFAGVLGAATFGGAYCDPYYYTWNYCGGYYPAYYGGYYPVYYSGYYPTYWGGYPVYRTRRVIYRNAYRPRRVIYRNVYRPRVVRYRAVAPRARFIGSRTYVRSGYNVRRGRR